MLNSSLVGGPSDIRDIRDADAVIIATPPDSHAEYIRRYLSEGKCVLVEKPFVTRTAEAEELIRLAAAKNAKILVGNFKRFYPSVIIARRIMESGVLGAIDRVEASDGMRWEWPAVSRYFVESPFGGVIYDTGAHLLDLVLFILSLDRDSVHFQINRIEKKPRQEPSHECRASLTLRSSNLENVKVDLSLSRVEPLARIVKIYGKQGLLLVPTTFSLTPELECENKDSILKSVFPETAARDETGCFLLEHLEMIDYLTGRSNPQSVLDGRNFISLVGLLETLSTCGG
jgi:predicted dehydrogenase